MNDTTRLRTTSAKAMRRFVRVAVCALLAGYASAADALACPSTGCLLANRNQAGLLAKGRLRVDLSFRHIDQGRRMEGASSSLRVTRPWIDFRDGRIWPAIHEDFNGRQQLLQVDVEYGLSAGTVVFASAPLIARRKFESGDSVCGLTNTTSDVGDVLLGARRALTRGRGILVAAAGLKIPTGEFQVKSGSGYTILDPMFQPGSGSWDGFASMQYAFKAGHPSLDWSALASYQLNGPSPLGYRFGNQSIGALSVARRVGRLTSLSMQVKGLYQKRSAMAGLPLEGSGGVGVVVTPAVRVSAGATSIYVNVPLPVFTYVNESQLASRFGVLVGVSRTFGIR